MTDATFKALADVYGILLKAGWSKPMGRIDGDVAFNGVDEVGTIDGWRRECDRLRQANQRLEAECERLHAQIDKLTKECDRSRGRAAQLEIQLRAAQSGDTTAGENEALRIIIRHLAKLL